MRRYALALLAVATLASLPPLRAQIAPPNEMGVSVAHFHPFAKDPQAESQFWTALGGRTVATGRMPVVKFPGILILISQGDVAEGSGGSVVNHVAFLIKDAKAAQAKWQDAGLKMITPFNASNSAGFLLSPSGVRVEVSEDKSLSAPMVFHHIQWATPDPAAVQAWYVKTFGAKPGTRANYAAADLPGANLTFGKSDAPTAPTKGRGLDHIGFEIKDLAAFCKTLEAAGQKFDTPCNPRPGAAVNLTYITDPFGTYIELTQGLGERFK